MAFDKYDYGQALEKLILMAAQGNLAAVTEDDAIEKICRNMKIARIEFSTYKDISAVEKHDGILSVLYDGGDTDNSRFVNYDTMSPTGNFFGFKAFQNIGYDGWTDEECSKINVFLNLMYVLCDREHLIGIADYLVFHDRELETYNIAHFVKILNIAIENHTVGKYDACYFNIKNFSDVNNLLGRTKATEVMKQYVGQLSSMLSSSESVCRMGGDNFTVLFYKENLEKVKNYLASAAVKYGDDGQSVVLRSSAGFYDIPDDCNDVATVMDCINIAKNVARSNMNLTSVFYNDEVMQRDMERRKYEQLFESAIENEEFKVYYQPKISLKKYKISGAEALCRWFHDGELIPPIKFIPVFEQNNSVCTLDFYMLEHVCRDIRSWLDNGKEVVRVSVNLSRCNLGEENLVERILAVVDKYNVPHEYIEIELTETTTDVAYSELKKVVFGLQANGISTAVDDFGIGYSSLNLISDLPWNVLKIDKKFLEVNTEATSHNYLMLKHIISLAQSFGIECVVEGVETVEHVKVLKENNCYMAQGFYFDKPLPREGFEKRLAMNK